MKINLNELKEKAKSRPIGYLEEVMSIGEVKGDFLEITSMDKYQELYKKYNPNIKGFGDVVAKVAQPIAKVIDKAAGTNIQNCQPCKQRQEKLNQMIPFSK